MAFQSAPDCAESVIHYTLSGKEIANVLNWKHTGGYGQPEIDGLADAVDGAVASELLPQLTSSCTYNFTHVRGLESSVDFEAIQDNGAGAGAQGGAVMPNNVTFALKLSTGQTGRSARGRFYFPGVAQAQRNANNTIAGAVAALWLACLQDIAAAALTEGWQLVVLSRYNNGVKLATAVARPVVSIGYTDLRVDTQRRRLPEA